MLSKFRVKVWCLPHNSEEEVYMNLHQVLVGVAKMIQVPGVEREVDMLCLFPSDLMEYGLGSEILVEVDGYNGAFSNEVVAEHFGDAVRRLYPEAMILCKVSRDDPSDVWFFNPEPYKEKEDDCKVHGSIEHMQSATGVCPGCGKY